ncbi:MAG TPA: ABC transporter permease [Longimicrobiales bacterium]|nr:ABC transporter permease [Longimicrobiales bacterium]
MPDLISELRHAARRLLRSPAFAAAAALTLALGVAANATIFTVVNRVVLRPLPYPRSDRLIWVDHVAPGIDLPGSPGLSQGLYRYYRERAHTFTDLAIYRRDEWTLTGEGDPQRIIGVFATASLGSALRTPLALGRWYTEKDAQDRAPVVVISHSLWTTRFGRDPKIIGRSIRLDGVPREIVGVTPASLAFPNAEIQLYIPERIDEKQVQTVGGFNYQSIARLRDGAAVADVKREIDALIRGVEEAFPGDPVAPMVVGSAKLAGAPEPLKDHVVGGVRKTLWILLGMVGFVLLIACANVANLFLVRSEARQREVAVRRALGAGRTGMVRYFLAESALLSLAGGALGLALATAGVRLLVRFGPQNLPRLNEIAVDAGTVAWTALLALLASLAFGAIPLLRRGRALAATLREGGRGSTAGRARFRARNALMAGQVALALVLLVGSGLMVRSFLRLRAVDPGFATTNVLTFDVSLTSHDYPDRLGAIGFHQALLERLRALPGVQAAGAATCLPLAGSCWGDPLAVRGRPLEPGRVPPLLQIRRAMPGFFQTMRIRLVEGRDFSPVDPRSRPAEVVLSRRAAELYFPGEDPIGKQVGFMFPGVPGTDGGETPWYTVVGVVGDTPVDGLDEKPYGIAYFPVVDPVGDVGSGVHGMAFAIRTSVPPMTLARAVRAAAAEVNPNVALGHVRSMETIVSDATARMAFTMMLLLIAGGIALLLGAVGIYGVISYVVGQRTGEIGLRMALGARPRDVSGMVLRQSGAVVGIGLGIGLAAALALSRLMASLLFQVTATDALTYAAVTTFLLAVAAVASWVPARRAAALDPTAALRTE